MRQLRGESHYCTSQAELIKSCMQRWGTLAHRNLPFKAWAMLVSCLGGKLSRHLLLTSTKLDAEKTLLSSKHIDCSTIAILLYLITFSFYADIDECVAGNSGCDVRADCVNTAGLYNCVCKDGFTGNGTICLGKKHVSFFSSCFCFVCLFVFCYLKLTSLFAA